MTAESRGLAANFSDPEATATGWEEETRKVLEEAELFWISTVRTAGDPTSHRSWPCGWMGRSGSPQGKGSKKFANLRANPRVVLTTGCSRWDQGLDVVVEGEAVPVTDDATLSRVPRRSPRGGTGGHGCGSARDGAFRGHDGSGGAMVFRVTPVKVFAHAKGDPFGETRHRF